jgi:hypothetical protein
MRHGRVFLRQDGVDLVLRWHSKLGELSCSIWRGNRTPRLPETLPGPDYAMKPAIQMNGIELLRYFDPASSAAQPSILAGWLPARRYSPHIVSQYKEEADLNATDGKF